MGMRIRKKLKHMLRGMRVNLIALFILFLLITIGQYIIRRTLMENAYETGTALSGNYASAEENALAVYESLLSFGSITMQNMIEEESSPGEIQSWVQKYSVYLQSVCGEKTVEPYFLIDGTCFGADGENVDVDFLTRQSWYQEALEKNGKTVYTDVYQSVPHDRPAVAMAQKINENNDVVMLNIFLDHFHVQLEALDLSFGDSFFLCDSTGKIIYKKTDMIASRKKMQQYVYGLMGKIKVGELESYDDFVIDMDRSQRAVYYSRLNNGWVSIITVPHSNILKNMDGYNVIFYCIIFSFILVFAALVAQDYRQNAKIERINETVRVLGNSYYALYRVDYMHNTYEMIKGSDHEREKLPPKGAYDDLLEVTGKAIIPDTCQEYKKSFSIENIKKLVSEEVRDFGGDFQRKFGKEYRWVSVRMLSDESLHSGEVVLCYREVEKEKQKQLQEQKLLENALDLAKKNAAAKQDFFRNMSHDMRTPLNAILGLSALAEDSCDNPEKMRDYIQKINASSRQLLNLINGILDLSRMQQDKILLNHQKFHLKECVDTCLEPFFVQAEHEKKKLKLEFSVENSWIMGDPSRVAQILNNMLSNALKFTVEGDSILVAVNQISGGEYPKYKFVVEDTGIGISKSFLPHLFEPYSRERRFNAEKETGIGLGMSITKNLIMQMEGEIYVESEPEKGTMFIFILPFAAAEDVRSDEEIEERELEEHSKEYSIEGLRILLAEDNEINMEITTELLSMNGASVSKAWNGKEAVSLFQQSPLFFYDMILLDMQMPEMDGCEAARRICTLQRPDAKKIPILAVTANAFAEDIAVTTAAGMDAHISKPIDFQALCRTIHQMRYREAAAQTEVMAESSARYCEKSDCG